MKKQIRNLKKYINKRAVKTTVVFLILFFILSIASIILNILFDNTGDIGKINTKALIWSCSIFFPLCVFFCTLILISEVSSVIRMDDEKIFLPSKGMVKFDNVRSISIRFVGSYKKAIAGTAFLQFFLIIVSLLCGNDCTAPIPEERQHFECIFHMKEGDDIKFLLQGYDIEQSREIIEKLKSKISRYYVL